MATQVFVRQATPQEVAEAWTLGVMNGRPQWVSDELARHPVPEGMVDPTYHRDDEGWHSASTITNPSAMTAMESWLRKRGLALPESTLEAWKVTLRRQERDAAVLHTVKTAVAQCQPGLSKVEVIALVIEALRAEVEGG